MLAVTTEEDMSNYEEYLGTLSRENLELYIKSDPILRRIQITEHVASAELIRSAVESNRLRQPNFVRVPCSVQKPKEGGTSNTIDYFLDEHGLISKNQIYEQTKTSLGLEYICFSFKRNLRLGDGELMLYPRHMNSYPEICGESFIKIYNLNSEEDFPDILSIFDGSYNDPYMVYAAVGILKSRSRNPGSENSYQVLHKKVLSFIDLISPWESQK